MRVRLRDLDIFRQDPSSRYAPRLVYLCTDMPACEDEEHLSKRSRHLKDAGESLLEDGLGIRGT